MSGTISRLPEVISRKLLELRSVFELYGIRQHCFGGPDRIHQLQGDLEQAQKMINFLREGTLRLGNTDLLPLLEAAQAEQRLVQGDAVSALRWARSFQREPLQDNMFKFELPVSVKARILVAKGNGKRYR